MPEQKKKKLSRNSSKTNKVTIAATIKAAKALELRMEGKTFEEIREELGYRSRQSAHRAVKDALEKTIKEPADELRALEIGRLDQMWQVAYINACAGDVTAIGACMRIMERRAKLTGIDAPVKQSTELTGANGGPIQQTNVTPEQLAEAVNNVRDKF